MTTLTVPQIETAILADGQTLKMTTSYSNLIKVSHTQRQKTLVDSWYVGLSNQTEVENTIQWLKRRGYTASPSTEKLTSQYEIVINWLSGPAISDNVPETIWKRLRDIREN